ncbi:glycosyltransferase [Reichenbachiella sp.]|uniref:glycosyltransferase n=1 Tax=Reichenbachiella sp. TaxID=2184521 RepID=UPI003B5A705D
MIESFAIGLVLIWVFFLSMLQVLKFDKKGNSRNSKNPFVSILISIRNEEKNMKDLCESLNKLSYPPSNFEILFGDDDSEDKTLEILQKYKPLNAAIFGFHGEADAFGKQKVLSQLAKNAKGSYLMFTDADMQFHPDWIQGMLRKISNEYEIVVGLTSVSGNDWLARLQNTDWLFNECIVGWFSRMGIGLTAWGNNLMMSKSTYDAIGGYEGLDQTIVEDVVLLRAVQSLGGKLVVNFDSYAVANTKPASFFDLLHQRKRWMKGLTGLNPLYWVGGMIKMFFWPALIFLTLGNTLWILLGPIAILLKSQLISRIRRVANIQSSIPHLLLFEIYDFVFYFLTFAFYLMPIKLIWKGRKY